MMIDKAKELGLALSESEEFQRVTAARAAFEQDAVSLALMDQYNDTQDKIVELLESTDPDPSEITALSQDLERLQGELSEAPAFVAVIEAQKQFQALMRQVNGVIGECIGLSGAEDILSFSSSSSGCSGSCASCAGCEH